MAKPIFSFAGRPHKRSACVMPGGALRVSELPTRIHPPEVSTGVRTHAFKQRSLFGNEPEMSSTSMTQSRA